MSIYIGNLSYQVTQEDIAQVFAEYGTVKRVQLPTDRETGRLRGFGFVEMATDAEEEAAVEALDGAEWMGRDLKVNRARPREERASSTWRSDSGTAIAIGGSSDHQIPSSREKPSLGSGQQQKSDAFPKMEISHQNPSDNAELKVVLKGSLGDISNSDLTILRERLRKISGDSSIEIVQVEEGSIVLKLSGTDEGFRVIKELWETGKLTTLIGLSIESVDYEIMSSETHGSNSDSIKPSKNAVQAEPSDQKNSEGSVNFIFDRCVVNQNNQTALSKSMIQTESQGTHMSENYTNNFQGANIANMANTVRENARQQANQHVYQSEQKQTLAESASEIQSLLKQLEQTNPNATEAEQVAYINDETTAGFKRRLVGALKAGSETAIEEFLDNPYVNVGKAIVKGWVKPD